MSLPTTANVADPRRLGYDALIGDLYVRLAVAPDRSLTVQTAEPERGERVQTQTNAEEFVEEFGRVFARDDFTGGEGLFAAHTREQRAGQATRFWDSRGIDVLLRRGEPPALRLLRDTELMVSGAGGRMAANDATTVAYVSPPTSVVLSTTATAGSPTWSTETPGPALVSDIAMLGGRWYVGGGSDGVYRRTGTNAWAQWSTSVADRVWAVKDRIITYGDGVLREIPPAGGAGTVLYTFAPGVAATGVADAGAGIAVGATNGYVYVFAPDDTGALMIRAQTPVRGESIRALTSTQGLLFYVSRGANVCRLWRARVADSGALVDVQLLREWQGAEGAVSVTSTRDDVVVAGRQGLEVHTWRYSLATGGLFRYLTFPVNSTPAAVVGVGERLFVATLSGGVWRDDPSAFVAEGWLIGPSGDLFTSSVKTWVDARLTAMVAGQERVSLAYSTHPGDLLDAAAAGWVQAVERTASSPAATRRLAGVRGRSIAGRVRLTAPPDRSTSPTVLAFGFRAYTSSADEIVTLPVNVSDAIERVGRRAIRVPGHGERVLQALLALRASATRLVVYRPAISVRGIVESVGAPIPAITRSGSPTAYALVRFRGARVAAGSVLGGAGLGISPLGISPLGDPGGPS